MRNYVAYGRVRGTEEWQPITWSGLNYYSDSFNILEELIFQMQQIFPQNEYKLEEVNE